VARLAQQMGIRTPVSRNYAITLGGLRQGVTVLDMAHAYETFAHRGELVTGRLAAANDGPVGVREVASGTGRHPKVIFRNGTVLRRVLPTRVADQVTEMMRTVVQYGTGHAANIGDFAAGKTGTTENYGDAWFVGFGRKYTVAVWVGHPDRLVPMKTEFRGGPVAGGTFPALIWRDFMLQAMAIDKARAERRSAQAAANEAQAQPQETTTDTTQTTTVETTTSPATPDTGTTGRGDGSGGDGGGGGKEPQPTPEPPAPAPKPTPQPQPTPPPQPPPGGSPGGVTPPSGGTSPPPTPGAGGDSRSGKTPNANPGGD
jgi:penicillin-binding protein 1A